MHWARPDNCDAPLVGGPVLVVVGMGGVVLVEFHLGCLILPCHLPLQPLQPAASEHGVDKAVPPGEVLAHWPITLGSHVREFILRPFLGGCALFMGAAALCSCQVGGQASLLH